MPLLWSKVSAHAVFAFSLLLSFSFWWDPGWWLSLVLPVRLIPASFTDSCNLLDSPYYDAFGFC